MAEETPLINHVEHTLATAIPVAVLDPADNTQAIVKNITTFRLISVNLSLPPGWGEAIIGSIQLGYYESETWHPHPYNPNHRFWLTRDQVDALETTLTDGIMENFTIHKLLEYLAANQEILTTN